MSIREIFIIELRKEKRTGVIPALLAVGVLGAAYAFVNFMVRGDALLRLPLAPMDILLTQLCGMLIVLNVFGIVVAACMVYGMEFKGHAMKKMYLLPIRASGIYFCKFLLLTGMFFVAVLLQNVALLHIGASRLPEGAFVCYPFLTALPVLSFMVLAASRFENMWVPLGIGVGGFLSGMALANADTPLLLLHPFVVMLRPAVAMSAQPQGSVAAAAFAEAALFLAAGLWAAGHASYE